MQDWRFASPMRSPSRCCSSADMRLGIAPDFDRGRRGFRWSPSDWHWSASRSLWEDKRHRAVGRQPSTWQCGDNCRLQLSRLALRGLDGERSVRGPAFEPVPGVELVIASEVEVSVPVRDWKEESNLRSDTGNARPEV